MSEGERRLVDATGWVAKTVASGSDVADPTWTSGRILLSNRRLIVVGRGGRREIPLESIDAVRGGLEVSGGVGGISNYSTLRVGDDVVLVSTKEHREFELALCAALLDGERVLVRHPAVEGGVVRETEWEPAGVKIGGDGTVNVTTTDGDQVSIELGDVGGVTVGGRTVREATQLVVEVEHTVGETSVQTRLGGSSRLCSVLKVLFERGLERNRSTIDLDAEEKQVLVALYSGISPFDIPEFIGIDVETTEAMYERLVDNDVLSEVRRRREVALTPRGRNLASEAINDE